MPIPNSDISIVMQGGLKIGYNVTYAAEYVRTVFPGATLILATQEAELGRTPVEGFDEVVATADPGALPSVKFDRDPNNLNRQIASSRAGLAVVKTPYALKMRTDAYLSSRKLVDLWSEWEEAPRGPYTRGEARILAVSFFTVNPRFDERLPYHVSDWLQFGRIADLRRFWDCPACDFDTATWYERHRHPSGSLPREREFRYRLATEQLLTLAYLYGSEPYPIKFHNDCSPEIVDLFEEELVDNFIIAHPIDIDLYMPKHRAVMKSIYFNEICYGHDDWKNLMLEKRGLERAGSDAYTRWPRTPGERKLYWFMRTDPRARWLERMPGRLGEKLRRYFHSWY